MIKLVKSLLGFGPGAKLKGLLKEGAQIIDVRTAGEFRSGHIRGSINIPLQHLNGSLSKIKKDKPVIVCCASGKRSASARIMLKANGYGEVYNGGGWISLQNKIL
jgi:phage shock protein E